MIALPCGSASALRLTFSSLIGQEVEEPHPGPRDLIRGDVTLILGRFIGYQCESRPPRLLGEPAPNDIVCDHGSVSIAVDFIDGCDERAKRVGIRDEN